MATKKRTTVVGVFTDRLDADRAVAELKKVGFRDKQIGMAFRDKARGGLIKKETLAEEGAVAGVLTGAGLGALVGLGVLAGVIPVIGPAIAGGTLGVLLSNAAGGAAIAGLLGGLVGLGIPEDEAEFYEKEFKAGRTIVTVKASSRYDEAVAIIRKHGGYDMASAAEAKTTTSRARTSARAGNGPASTTVEVKEEELRPRKTVKSGEVKVRKDVVTEHKTIDVPVTREEVVVERRPASGRRAASSIKSGEEIRIPVRKEEVTAVEKTPVVKEEVRVGKRTVQENKTFSGTVRRERAKVEREGDVTVCETKSRDRK